MKKTKAEKIITEGFKKSPKIISVPNPSKGHKGESFLLHYSKSIGKTNSRRS